jgi:hypothetical protein
MKNRKEVVMEGKDDLVSSLKCYLLGSFHSQSGAHKKERDPFRRLGLLGASILIFVCAIQLLFYVTVFRKHSQNVVG